MATTITTGTVTITVTLALIADPPVASLRMPTFGLSFEEYVVLWGSGGG